jgi:1-phosphatidylinositol-4-phosphate 5-kinase
MLKTIPEREFESLQEALPNYHKMMQDNPDSLLSRFYGMFRMRWADKDDKKTRYLVVMNNVFKDFKVGNRFDLKGSTAGREALKGADRVPTDLDGVAMKDNDFIKYYKCLNLIDN